MYGNSAAGHGIEGVSSGAGKNGVRKGYENFEPITDSAKLLKKLDQADAQERGK